MDKNILQGDNDFQKKLRLKSSILLATPYKALRDVLLKNSRLNWYDLPEEDEYNDCTGSGSLIDKLTDPGNLLIKTLWSKEWRSIVASAVEYRLQGVYQYGYLRRCFRSAENKKPYAGVIQLLLANLLQALKYDLTPQKALELFAQHGSDGAFCNAETFGILLAIEYDKGNPLAVEIIKSAVYDDNQAMTYEVLTALFYAKNPQAHQMAGELLLAARLQEGLRQSIVEKCSDGRLEAFKHILKIIEDNNLIRYSSIVRALNVWADLGLEPDRIESCKRVLHLMNKFLNDTAAIESALNDGDPLELYIALWAAGNIESEPIIQWTAEMILAHKRPLPHRAAALDFLYSSGNVLTPMKMVQILNDFPDSAPMQALLLKSVEMTNREIMTLPESTIELQMLCDCFMTLARKLPAKKQKIKHPAFGWYELELVNTPAYLMALYIAVKSRNTDLLENLAAAMPDMPAMCRERVMDEILEYQTEKPESEPDAWLSDSEKEKIRQYRKNFPRSPRLRQILFTALQDKSISVRQKALNIISRLEITESELIQVEDLLALKTPELRMGAMELIKSMHCEARSAARLRQSGNAEKIAAADELAPAQTAEKLFDEEHGFGLYDVNDVWEIPRPASDIKYHPKSILDSVSKKDLQNLESLLEFFLARAATELEYEYNDGEKIIITLDKLNDWTGIRHARKSQPPILQELTDEVRKTFNFDLPTLLKMYLLLCNVWQNNFFEGSAPSAEEIFGSQKLSDPSRYFRYRHMLATVIYNLLQDFPDFPSVAGKLLISLAVDTPEKCWFYNFPAQKRRNGINLPVPPDWAQLIMLQELFFFAPFNKDTFYARLILFNGQSLVAKSYSTSDAILPWDVLMQAYDQNWISENQVRRIGCCYLKKPDASSLNGFNAWQRAKHPLLEKMIYEALEAEFNRGDLPTAFSKFVHGLKKLSGAEYYIRAIDAMQKYHFERGEDFYGDDRASVFSRIVRISRPLPTDTVEVFAELVKKYNISRKKLIESAMYSPAWLALTGKYLNIENLEMAGWYFHAHVSEFFSAEKETCVARYSAITPAEFNDGAFDRQWFADAVNAVGEKVFAELYNAAKYISGGANHRRSQIFADAAQGKLDKSAIEENMQTKRNKELVMAYGILPQTDDILHRYNRLMAFRKESSQFGNQRQTAEKLAVNIALGNLARTAGFSDTNRFLWSMEAVQLESMQMLFLPQTADDTVLQLGVDDNGIAHLSITQNGKVLKSVPAKLKKDARIVELQNAVRNLRNQHKRARISLEEAMVRQDIFAYSEVESLLSNPVLSPMVKKLLWINETGTLGFAGDFSSCDNLKIAHPVDLLDSGKWSYFQQYIVENQIIQPFKQLFRELYTPDPDEKFNDMESQRYAGHQIQPRKGIALLRTRGWTVDTFEGLQKVFHRENIIVRLRAMADWLSPSEIELPTLESITFCRRTGDTALKISEIPPVIFSEVMRDLDLLVSCAHAGNVDPEASHSTVEMRANLLNALLPLLKLDNVMIQKNHAVIQGKYGEYSIHLGSGTCHKTGHGSVNILPVHSQHRGRIFLPFADDDPRTAEILSKVILFSEDHKIKDPDILSQIR